MKRDILILLKDEVDRNNQDLNKLTNRFTFEKQNKRAKLNYLNSSVVEVVGESNSESDEIEA